MKSNGYTLVEVLAVIIILSLLTAVIIPTMDSIIKTNKEKAYDLQVELLLDGIKNWGAANAFNLPTEEGESITKTVGELKKAGFLEKELRNPITDSCVADDLELMIKRNNNKYIYSIVGEKIKDGSEENCK